MASNLKIGSFALTAAALGLLSGLGAAQTYSFSNSQIPTGAPFNNSASENVDFGDVDLDGDFDAIFADGGDGGNDQNRIWINLGGAQGGTIGFFADETSTRFPALQDQSRDIEFADIDDDGDLDIYTSNTAAISPQSNRWWINMGGAQGGTAGFYSDETASRWVGIAQAGSSVPNTLALGTGGFIDWSCDCDFGDLDNDGDLDLAHSTYGGVFNGNVPTRMFLNDGGGHFTEFNPSGFQLSMNNISNGNPGLWCEGTQQANTTNSNGTFCDIASSALDIDLGDIDGDLDLDMLHGARQEAPRMFTNRFEENGGSLGFRDVTGAAFPSGYSSGNGHYEQEMADLDADDDLDIYGLNWLVQFGFTDTTMRNTGNGVYDQVTTLTNSGADDNEGDFVDYDNDGDLDLFVCNFSGQEKLYRNNYAGAGFSFTFMNGELPSDGTISLDADVCDIELDGDYDIIVANDNGATNPLLKNNSLADDVHAPRVVNLEQAPDRTPGPTPTVVRVQVYDNAAYYVTWYNPTTLEYSVNGGAFTPVAMKSSQGQIFRGEIPGALAGSIAYRVRSVDAYGNQGTSVTKTYNATGGCSGSISTYCTAKTSSNGCVPAIGSLGTPAPGAGFTITGAMIEANQIGVAFYSTNGPLAQPFQGGFLCAMPPVLRLPVQNAGGAGACTGTYSFNIDGVVTSVATGTQFWFQLWFRDPGAASGTGLSNALTFTTCP